MSLDDIEHLIDTGTAEGVVEPLEQKLALGALRLGERTVRDIMRPRIDLDAMDVDTPPEEVLGTVAMAGFSRLPVYEGDLDHVIGSCTSRTCSASSILAGRSSCASCCIRRCSCRRRCRSTGCWSCFRRSTTSWRSCSTNTAAPKAWSRWKTSSRKSSAKCATSTAGTKSRNSSQRDDNSWLVDGAVSIADLIDRLELDARRSLGRPRLQHVAGLILDQLGPHSVDRRHGRVERPHLEVVDMDGQRIDRVLVTRSSGEGGTGKAEGGR